MMTTKQYIIGFADYDACDVFGAVEGSADRDLHKLFRQYQDGETWKSEGGYDGFVNWLCKEHDFVKLDMEVYWL
jgi:hypothetical protein